MAKKCVAILWDIRQRVFGVRLEKNASGALILTAYAQSIESRITFAERLREVYLELDHGRADYVVVGGAVGELICQELVMPEMKFSELHDALGYQLRSLLPIDLSQLNLAFRKMVLPDRAGFCRVRVQAAPGKPLQATFDALAAAGIKADLFLHPCSPRKDLPLLYIFLLALLCLRRSDCRNGRKPYSRYTPSYCGWR